MKIRNKWGQWKSVIGSNGLLYLTIKPSETDDFTYAVPAWELAGEKKWEWINKLKAMEWVNRKIVRDLRKAIQDLYSQVCYDNKVINRRCKITEDEIKDLIKGDDVLAWWAGALFAEINDLVRSVGPGSCFWTRE